MAFILALFDDVKALRTIVPWVIGDLSMNRPFFDEALRLPLVQHADAVASVPKINSSVPSLAIDRIFLVAVEGRDRGATKYVAVWSNDGIADLS